MILKGESSLFVRVKFKTSSISLLNISVSSNASYISRSTLHSFFFLVYKIIYEAECVWIYAFLTQCFYRFGCNTKAMDDKKVFIPLRKQKVVLWTLQMCVRLSFEKCFECYTIQIVS